MLTELSVLEISQYYELIFTSYKSFEIRKQCGGVIDKNWGNRAFLTELSSTVSVLEISVNIN
jgi:hypothetical protein